MGCCGCKADPAPVVLIANPKPLDRYFKGVVSDLTQSSSALLIRDHLFDEVEAVALDLMHKATWNELLSNEQYELKFCEVSSKQGSVFNSNVYVVSFKLYFQEVIDLGLLTRLLTNPLDRLAWDASLDDFSVISEDEGSQLIYYVLKMPFVMRNRDLVEQQFLKYDADRVRIAAKSVEVAEVKPKIERGINYFRYQILQHGSSGTEILTISQVDLAGSIPKTMAKHATSAVTTWAESLIKAVREWRRL